MKNIDTLIKTLEKIAKKNKDEFAYLIKIIPTAKGCRFDFEANEIPDGHVFVSGEGSTVDEAIDDTLKYIDDACEAWGYKQ